MLPIMRLYTSDGSLSFRNRSGYVSVFKLLMSGTVFVALLCTRSIASISLIDQSRAPYCIAVLKYWLHSGCEKL